MQHQGNEAMRPVRVTHDKGPGSSGRGAPAVSTAATQFVAYRVGYHPAIGAPCSGTSMPCGAGSNGSRHLGPRRRTAAPSRLWMPAYSALPPPSHLAA